MLETGKLCEAQFIVDVVRGTFKLCTLCVAQVSYAGCTRHR